MIPRLWSRNPYDALGMAPFLRVSLVGLVGLSLAGLGALSLSACQGREEGDALPRGPRIKVERAWVRAMPTLPEEGGGVTNTAAYLVLRNQGDGEDRLTGGITTAAKAVELHESTLVDDIMRMRRIDGVTIPPLGTVELKPGGMHIMLMGLTTALTEGDELSVTLHFQRSPDLTLTVPVQASGGA